MNRNLKPMTTSRVIFKGSYLLMSIIALLFLQTSCSLEEEVEKNVLALSESTIYVAMSGGTATIAVTASEPWGAVPDDDETWCSLTLSETRLIVRCTANNTSSSRSATIKISTAHLHKYLTVRQSRF